jgi:hypothetical protein
MRVRRVVGNETLRGYAFAKEPGSAKSSLGTTSGTQWFPRQSKTSPEKLTEKTSPLEMPD